MSASRNANELASHLALVGLKSFSNDGIALMRKVFQSIDEECEVISISSVYRIEGELRSPKHVHDLKRVSSFDGLSVVAKVETSMEPGQLLEWLQKVGLDLETMGEHRSLSLNLLSYDDITVMTSSLTLPHPEFHLKPESLFPAVEIWPEYLHPVLKESLNSLTKRFANLRWGEFHSQGKTLLDFSEAQA
ncbi:MAG: 2-amino-4-hydroxy-6-hydroxymethyldihydropteridine diphosphokinase [Bdellovibrionales bacterium]|nr:2-amino-4-hydroxy-6-hydroxymethyldihydropteridine diphosphokinase [Bdellovibrionales bacterium]